MITLFDIFAWAAAGAGLGAKVNFPGFLRP
jgi:hypothetical protein